MDDTAARRFFLQPTNDSQRLYEALHAVFVDGSLQKEVAQRFGYPFDAFRQHVHQFRTRCASGQPPPFSAPGRGAGRRLLPAHRGNPNSLPSRIAAPGT